MIGNKDIDLAGAAPDGDNRGKCKGDFAETVCDIRGDVDLGFVCDGSDANCKNKCIENTGTGKIA